MTIEIITNPKNVTVYEGLDPITSDLINAAVVGDKVAILLVEDSYADGWGDKKQFFNRGWVYVSMQEEIRKCVEDESWKVLWSIGDSE